MRPSLDIPAREQLGALYASGMSLYSLGDHYGVSPSTIKKWMKKYELPRRPRAEATRAANLARPQGNGSRGGSPRARAVYRARDKRIAIVRQYRESRGCEVCGVTHPAVLDLHHKDSSTKHPQLRSYRTANGHKRLGRGWREVPLRDLQAELEKCVVLCANCHRITEWYDKRDKEST